MAFAADITGTLAGLLPAQQAVASGLAAPAAPRPVRKVEKKSDALTQAMTPAGELLPIALIREAVQECLQDSIHDNTGSLYALMADDEIVQLLHKLMGRPGDKETVGHSLQDLVDSFAALAAKDGQPEDVVRAIGRFTDKLKYVTGQLTALRQQAAEQLTQGLSRANELLAKIAETNRQITVSSATGIAMPQAGSAQAANLLELAKTIDFSSFRREDGSVAVFTKQGMPLAKDKAVQLVPSDKGIQADGIDIAGQFSGGAVHASLHNRDQALPNVQSQLDTLAQTLQSRINQLSNRAVGGADARAVYRGSRVFTDPAGLRMSLAGGDTEILVLREDGGVAHQVTLSFAVKQYRRTHNLPISGPWPVGQVAAALGAWLSGHLPNTPRDCVRLSAEGRLHIDLPPAGLRLAIRDSRTLSLQSKLFAHPDKPLGGQGQLVLSDGLGNEFSTSPARGGAGLTPHDSLRQIAAKLERLEGLSAHLVSAEHGACLMIDGKGGSDLAIEPDGGAEGIATLLAALPADDQAREDVAVNAVSHRSSGQASSRLFANPGIALSLHGSLILRDPDGAMLAFQTPQPDWSLERLVDRLQSASDPRISAGLIKSGNQFALRIACVAADDRFVIEGLPEGWQSSPRFNFLSGGGDLTLALAGAPLGSLSIAAGSTLAQIAGQIGEESHVWARAGIRAQVLRAGNAEILDIGHSGGLPLSFGGTACGAAPGQLDLRYNLRDHLGLAAPADQVVPGFANFFGMNDLFVAEPSGAFDAKAAIGVFATTALSGTAAALALNPGMLKDPSSLGAAATIRQISDLLCNAINIPEAGDLPRGSYCLAHYAEAIVRQIDNSARNNRVQLTYHRALLDRLASEKTAEIDVNRRLQTLMTLQQTYHDATQMVAGLSQLNEQLRVH